MIAEGGAEKEWALPPKPWKPNVSTSVLAKRLAKYAAAKRTLVPEAPGMHRSSLSSSHSRTSSRQVLIGGPDRARETVVRGKREVKNKLKRRHTFQKFGGLDAVHSVEDTPVSASHCCTSVRYFAWNQVFNFAQGWGFSPYKRVKWWGCCCGICLAFAFILVVLPALFCWAYTVVFYEELYELEQEQFRDRHALTSFSETIWDSWLMMWEYIWMTWTYFVEPGNHAVETAAFRRWFGFFETVLGILTLSILTAGVVEGVRILAVWFRSEGPRVVSKDHFLIIGWTEKTINVIGQLAEGCAAAGGTTIVVLGEESKHRMELDMAANLTQTELKGSHAMFRQGSAMRPADLRHVSINTARAVIVLPTTANADKADAHVLRTVLSMRALSSVMRGHVVAEIRDIDNEALFKVVGGDKVETVVSHDIVGQMLVHCARNTCVPSLYDALIGFYGDEFYFKKWPELQGLEYIQIMYMFEDAIPIGVVTAIGDIMLNPPDQTIFQKNWQLIVIAEDELSYSPQIPMVNQARLQQYFRRPIRRQPQVRTLPEDILIVGWRRDVDDIIALLDCVVCPGSSVHLLSEVPIDKREERLRMGGLDIAHLENVELHHYVGNSMSRQMIRSIQVNTFDSVLILADETFEEDTLHCDSHSLASLLMIRDQLYGDHSSMRRSTLKLRKGYRHELHEKKQLGKISNLNRHNSSDYDSFNDDMGDDFKATPGVSPVSFGTGQAHFRHHEVPEPPSSETKGTPTTVVGPQDSSSSLDTMISSIAGRRRSPPPVASAAKAGIAVKQGDGGSPWQQPSSDYLGKPRHSFSEELRQRSLMDARQRGVHRKESTRAVKQSTNLVCEIIDSRTNAFASEVVSDYILSTNEVVSRVVAMVAKERRTIELLNEMWGPKGCHIKLQPASDYIDRDVELSFVELSLKVRRCGDILLGYRVGKNAVVLNPPDKLIQHRWAADHMHARESVNGMVKKKAKASAKARRTSWSTMQSQPMLVGTTYLVILSSHAQMTKDMLNTVDK